MGVAPKPGVMADTKDSREEKGKNKEKQRREHDIEREREASDDEAPNDEV